MSLQVIGIDTGWSAAYDFLLTYHSNHHGPISYRFQDKRRFQSKTAVFPPRPLHITPRWGVTLGIVNRRSGSTSSEGLRKKFNDIFNQLDTIHQRHKRATDVYSGGFRGEEPCLSPSPRQPSVWYAAWHRYGSYQRYSFLICCSVSVYFTATCSTSTSYIWFAILVWWFYGTFSPARRRLCI